MSDAEENEVKEDVTPEVVKGSDEKNAEPDYKEKYVYVLAEMDNARKRFEREKESIIKYGNEKILKGLLDVVDNLDRTIQAVKNENDDKVKSIRVGVEMVRKQFLDVLECNGLRMIDAEGKMFDPHFHEAVGRQDVEDRDENTIVQEYQKGYVLNGRVLRASKVVVCQRNNE